MRHAGSLLRLAGSLEAGELADAELLGRFRDARDGAAFAELVRRHGPMVMGVCRRVLRHRQDAEDAYQAAFLVLARRAGDVARPERLAGWLHGVATRTALEARKRARSLGRERQVSVMPDPPAPHPTEPSRPGDDLRAVLDEELARLPEKFRVAVVLCDIEGRTREEAAAQLGVPVGTLSGRLTTAHRKLAGLLVRRGVASVGAALAALTPARLTAAVPAALAATTADAGVAAAAKGLAASGASHHAVELAQAVVRALRAARWKATLLLLVGGVVLGPGVALALQGAPAWAPAPVGVPVPESVRGTADVAPVPRALRARHEPIVNDMNDIFVVSDLDEGVPDYFRHNRLTVTAMSAPAYRELASSKDLWVTVPLAADNSANDPKRTPRNAGGTAAVVPPSDAVRRLLDPIARTRVTFNAILRHEGTAGSFDLVGYTDRPTDDFFGKDVPVLRSGAVTQKDLLFEEPPVPTGVTVPALRALPNAPSVVIANTLRGQPAPDLRVASDRAESVSEYFRRNRVAVGCVLVSDYDRVVAAGEPLEVPVFHPSYNDEAPLSKRRTRTVLVAPPAPFTETRLFRPALRARQDIDAMTVVFRRDEPGAALEPVGFATWRTAFHFFEKGVRFDDTGTQRDLLYRPHGGDP